MIMWKIGGSLDVILLRNLCPWLYAFITAKSLYNTHLEQTMLDHATSVLDLVGVEEDEVGPYCLHQRLALCPTTFLQQVQSKT